ncbi:MAG: QueT transporter family protein [Defluviitaleaceae bacterium]|nr:QueT transporter family protein [Defluviitaleaceae bacterium]
MKNKINLIAANGMIAAVYAALTILLPFQHEQIQVRVAEALTLLAFFNPLLAPGIVAGCFIANLFSSVNPLLDAVFGTLHSAVALLFIVKFSKKNLFLASLWPTVFSFFIGFMIALEVSFGAGAAIFMRDFAFFTLTVMAGQFVAVSVIGFPLFTLLSKNEKLIELIRRFK